MKKHGFTLVEVLVVIGLITVLGIGIGITLNRNMKKQQEQNYDDYIYKIKSAANLYLTNNNDILNELNSGVPYTTIKIENLVNKGYISNDLKNPNTNSLDLNDNIKLTMDANGVIIIEYPTIDKPNNYLDVPDLVINTRIINNSNDLKNDICNKNIAYIDKAGHKDNNYDFNNVKCYLSDNLKLTEPYNIGTFQINYEYLGYNNILKKTIRNVIIKDDKKPTCGEKTQNSTWVNRPVQVAIGCNDEVKCIQSPYVESFVNIEKTFIKVKDTSGNESEPCEVNVYSDTINPDLSINVKGKNNNEIQEITFKGTDSLSGIKCSYYDTNGSLTKNDIIKNNCNNVINKIKIDNEYGTRTYYLYAIDNAGNFNKVSKEVKIEDKTPPTVNLTVSSNGWTNQDVTIDGNASDSGSKITSLRLMIKKNIQKYRDNTISVDKKESVSLNETSLNRTMTEEGIYEIKLRATDGAGNSKDSSTVAAYIDKTAPTISSFKANKVNNKGKKTVTFDITDNLSGIKRYCVTKGINISSCYSWNNVSNDNIKSLNNTIDNPNPGYTIYLFVEDKAGNITSQSLDTGCIDTIEEKGTCTKKCGNETTTLTVKDKYNSNRVCVPTKNVSCDLPDCCSSTTPTTNNKATACNYTCGEHNYTQNYKSAYDGSACPSKQLSCGLSKCSTTTTTTTTTTSKTTTTPTTKKVLTKSQIMEYCIAAGGSGLYPQTKQCAIDAHANYYCVQINDETQNIIVRFGGHKGFNYKVDGIVYYNLSSDRFFCSKSATYQLVVGEYQYNGKKYTCSYTNVVCD